MSDWRTAVRVALAKRNWRQKELAEILGIKQPHTSKLMSGKCELTLAHAVALHEKLGIPMGVFFK